MSLSRRLRRLLVRTEVLEEFTLDGVPYAVLEKTSPVPFYKGRRLLSFKKDGQIFNHSAVFLSPRQKRQPIYLLPQRIFSLWATRRPPASALVLGCAGCTVPRFLALSWPECRVTGVEYSEKLVEVARRCFLLDEIADRFTLLCDDAFRYLPANPEPKRSLIYVDIYDGNVVPEAEFSPAFAAALYAAAAPDCVVVVNLLNVPLPRVEGFLSGCVQPWSAKYLLTADDHRFAILENSTDPAAQAAFADGLAGLGQLESK